MKVGMIGLGTMGLPITKALVAAGQELVAFDVSQPALERVGELGVTPLASPAEVGAQASIVLLSLPLPAHVASVVTGDNGLLTNPATDLIIMDTSTVDPATTRQMAAAADKAGVAYLDAPVLGRPVSCGNWTFPVGGDEQALERARPILEILGKAVIHVGPSGSGNAVKLLNNLMFGVINSITAEVMATCESVGLSPRTFYDTVVDSGAATVSPLFRELGPKILDRDFSPTFTLDLMRKDVALALAMIGDAGGRSPVGDAALSVTDIARDAGLGAEDSCAVIKVYESSEEAG